MKTKTNALLLAFFLGGFGAHKFYLDKPGQGLAYLLFCWTLIPGLIAVADMLHIALMNDPEFHRRFNPHLLGPANAYGQNHGMYGGGQYPAQGYPQPGYQQPYGMAQPHSGYATPVAHGQAPAYGQPQTQAPQYGQPQAPAPRYGHPQPPAPQAGYVPPAEPLPQYNQQPPDGDYEQRLAYLEYLRQSGALNEDAYQAALAELRRSN